MGDPLAAALLAAATTGSLRSAITETAAAQLSGRGDVPLGGPEIDAMARRAVDAVPAD